MSDYSPKTSNKGKIAFGITTSIIAVTAVAIPVAIAIANKEPNYVLTISDNIQATQDYSLEIKKGTKIEDLTAESRAGYTFIGWFKDASCTEAYELTDVISANTTIFAKYEAKQYTINISLPQGTALKFLKTDGSEYQASELTNISHGTTINFKISSDDELADTEYYYVVNNNETTMENDEDGIYSFVVEDNTTITFDGRFEYLITDTDVNGKTLATEFVVINNYINYNESTAIVVPDEIVGLQVKEIYNISGGDLSTENTVIEELHLPKYATYVNAQHLKLCSALSTISVASENTVLTVDNNILYSIDNPTEHSVVFCPTNIETENVSLLETTTTINDYAFAYCNNISTVNLGSLTNLSFIGDCAFMSTGVTAVTLPTSLTWLGYSAFNSCNTLKEVNLYCKGLDLGYVLVYWDYSHVNVCSYAFANCPALEKVYWNTDLSLSWAGTEYEKGLASGIFYNSGTTNGVEFTIGKDITSFDPRNVFGNNNSTYVSLGSVLKLTSIIFENGSQAAFTSFQNTLQNTLHSVEQLYIELYNNLPAIYFEKSFFDEPGTNPADTPLEIIISWYDRITFEYDSSIANDKYYVFVQKS